MNDKPHFITQTEYEGGFRHFPTLIQAAGPRVQNGDWLALTLTTSDATGSVEINGRILTDQAEIVPFTQLMTFSGTGSQTAIVARLGGGWLQGFSVHRVSGTLTDGEVVAAVHLGTGEGTTARLECCLASGELTDIRSLGMGAFLIRGPSAVTNTATPEVPTVTVGNDPAAGAEFSVTVPASQVWKLYALRATLVTDANVANRVVQLVLDDGTNTFHQLNSGVAQVATTTNSYSWGNIGASNTGTVSTAIGLTSPLPLFLAAGYRIRSVTANIQATDNWGTPVVFYSLYSV